MAQKIVCMHHWWCISCFWVAGSGSSYSSYQMLRSVSRQWVHHIKNDPRGSTECPPRLLLLIKIKGMRPQGWIWTWHSLKREVWISVCGGVCARVNGTLLGHRAGGAAKMMLWLSSVVEGVKENLPVSVYQLSWSWDPWQFSSVVLRGPVADNLPRGSSALLPSLTWNKVARDSAPSSSVRWGLVDWFVLPQCYVL